MLELIAFITVGLAGFAVGRYRAHRLQRSGESIVSIALQAAFPGRDYHLLNSITVALEDR